MSWYRKMTSISGYSTTDPKPDDFDARYHWAQKHIKVFVLKGHWDTSKALAYARKRGIVTDVKIEHSTSDLNGKSRGGIDKRWLASESSIVEVAVSATENEAWAETDCQNVWDSETA